MNSFFLVKNINKLWIVFIVVGFCLFSSYATAASKFSWLPNSETDIAGYKIYYGLTDGGPYPNVVDVGKPGAVDGRIHGEVSGLECGPVYYLVCAAYTIQGTESDYSTQIVLTVADITPETPTELIVVP